jgi:hypothetical protein
MAVNILLEPKTTLAPMPQALSLQELAEELCANALDEARQKFGTLGEDLDTAELLRMPAFVTAFKHSLARHIAATLAENDASVQAAYTYDPSMNPDSECGDDLPVDVTIHLLVHVTHISAALETFIAALDRTLTAILSRLPSAEFAQRTSFLDVNLLTDEDARRGTRYAAFLSSLFAPPLRVW